MLRAVGRLDGKVAIVTGGGRGIGRGEALLLAAEGASVVVNDVDRGAADAVVDEIAAAGGKGLASSDDVSTWSGGGDVVRTAVEELGGLDVLVNNAGILRDAMSFNLDEESWDAVIAVHLKGHAAPSRAAAAHWRERSKAGEAVSGRIINTSSEAGLFGNVGQLNYSAAKAGIASMTMVLARELGRYGVTANAIVPRARTRMTEALLGLSSDTEGFDEWHPDNIAPVVAWLATDAAAHVTGQVLFVFGGQVDVLREWTSVGKLERDDRWTVADLEARAGDLFRDRDPGVPPIGIG
jgi:NAD(P)-dependent dehydrogenase (short-subunit alcohol dehydrogenase family)